MLHMDKTINKTANTVNRKSFALNGMLSIFACVEGTQPQPNTSTRMKLSNILYIGINIGIMINGNTAIILFFMIEHLFTKGIS